MSFARSLGFAALAAAGIPLFVAGLGPFLGHALALQLYLVSAGVAYAASMAPDLRRAFVAATLAAALGGFLLLLPLRLPAVAAGSALTLALVRSSYLYRGSGLRGVGLELGLQAAGLLLAAHLAGSGLMSLAMATWGYFLVQSLFFLVGGLSLRRSESQADPFDAARSRLLALLD